MPQPKSNAGRSTKRATGAGKPPSGARRAPAKAKAAAPPAAQEHDLGDLVELLTKGLVLTVERVQEAMDDAVRRGRMTRDDAEDLVQSLVEAGRKQTDELRADLESLIGRSLDLGGRPQQVRAGRHHGVVDPGDQPAAVGACVERLPRVGADGADLDDPAREPGDVVGHRRRDERRVAAQRCVEDHLRRLGVVAEDDRIGRHRRIGVASGVPSPDRDGPRTGAWHLYREARDAVRGLLALRAGAARCGA